MGCVQTGSLESYHLKFPCDAAYVFCWLQGARRKAEERKIIRDERASSREPPIGTQYHCLHSFAWYPFILQITEYHRHGFAIFSVNQFSVSAALVRSYTELHCFSSHSSGAACGILKLRWCKVCIASWDYDVCVYLNLQVYSNIKVSTLHIVGHWMQWQIAKHAQNLE